MSIPIASIEQIIATILKALDALGGLIPIKDAIAALVGAASRSPHLPVKADGSPYTESELDALVVEAGAKAHAAWHVGDLSSS